MGNKHLKDKNHWDFGGRTLGLKKNELESRFLLLALTLEEAPPAYNSTKPKVLRSMIEVMFQACPSPLSDYFVYVL